MERLFFLALIFLPTLLAIPLKDLVCPDKNPIHVNVLHVFAQQMGQLDFTFTSSDDSLEFNASTIIYTVYNKANINGTEIGFEEGYNIINKSTFDLSLKTVFLISGWLDSQMSITLKQALFEVGDYNVIVVNWDTYSQQWYEPAVEAVPYVGFITARLINDIIQTYNYSLENITMIGHSLGAHISGFAGKATNGLIGAIIGLDPANPCYYEDDPAARLNASDAKYVQVMHTNAGILGANYVIGHIDFWPNGGTLQSGCFVIDVKCSHLRAFDYMGESITNNQFYAKTCETYESYNQGECNNNIPTLMGGKLEAYDVQVNGNYYLNTNSESPYGLGNVNP